jgi:hypothetical protein
MVLLKSWRAQYCKARLFSKRSFSVFNMDGKAGVTWDLWIPLK